MVLAGLEVGGPGGFGGGWLAGLEVGGWRVWKWVAIESRMRVEENCHYWNEVFWLGKCVERWVVLGKGVRFGFHSER